MTLLVGFPMTLPSGLCRKHLERCAARDSSSWSALRAPMIVEATKSKSMLQAVASVTGDMPASLAISRYLAGAASVPSLTKRFAIACCLALAAPYSAKREFAGGDLTELEHRRRGVRLDPCK